MYNHKNQYTFKAEPKEKVYSKLLAQLDRLENSTISTASDQIDETAINSLELGFKLFPIIEFIAYHILDNKTPRYYFRQLGYSRTESHLLYYMFRNGFMHNLNPHTFIYNNGIINWGVMSSSGSSGFRPHYPGYEDSENPENSIPADKAFAYVRLQDNSFHASLSLDRLIAQIKYDVNKRNGSDNRTEIEVISGLKFNQIVPRARK